MNSNTTSAANASIGSRIRYLKHPTLEVPPHIAAFCEIEIERRARPTLGLKQGAEQKRAKTRHNACLLRKRRDLHPRRIGIGGSEIEPEVEKRGHHEVVHFLSRVCHPRANGGE